MNKIELIHPFTKQKYLYTFFSSVKEGDKHYFLLKGRTSKKQKEDIEYDPPHYLGSNIVSNIEKIND